MPSKSAIYPLLAIRENANLAREWLAGDTAERFRENRQLLYAVTRCLEIVSEASRRLPPDVRERHPDLPWRAIMDVGNVYRHEYDNVSEDLVWHTVRDRLPALLAAVDREIAALSSGTPPADG
jgi:uncharacterized protein with HEPN domain